MGPRTLQIALLSENGRMEPLAPGQDLYAVEPEEFTAARNSLVKQLRREDRKDDAAAVASLRRPPATAWALNVLARDRPELVQAVLDAGQRLRSAMERAVDGDASTLRDAQLEERRSIDTVTAAAVARLEATGRAVGDTSRRRMAATLQAAVVDPTVAEALVAGVLDADHDAPGFGLESLTVGAAAQQTSGQARGGSSKGDAGTAPARTGTNEQRSAPESAPGEPARGSTAHDQAERRDPERARRQHLRDAEADEAEQRARKTERAAVAAEHRARDLRAAATAAAEEAEAASRRARDLEHEATAAQDRAK